MRSLRAALALLALPLAPASADESGAAEAAEMKRVCAAAGPVAEGVRSTSRPLSPGDRDYDRLSGLVPRPPPGWRTRSETVEAFLTDTVGCGLAATRSFETGRGELSIGVALVASPIAALMAKSLAAGPAPHMTVAGRPVLVDEKGTATLPVGRIVVTASGSAPEAEKRALLESLDFAAIERAAAPR